MPRISEGVMPIVDRGKGNFSVGLIATLSDMAREVDAASDRLRIEAPLTKQQARKAICAVMRKGYEPAAGATAILAHLRELKAQGLEFDEDGIARLKGVSR